MKKATLITIMMVLTGICIISGCNDTAKSNNNKLLPLLGLAAANSDGSISFMADGKKVTTNVVFPFSIIYGNIYFVRCATESIDTFCPDITIILPSPSENVMYDYNINNFMFSYITCDGVLNILDSSSSFSLTITEWGPVGGRIKGSFSGTLSSWDCSFGAMNPSLGTITITEGSFDFKRYDSLQ